LDALGTYYVNLWTRRLIIHDIDRITARLGDGLLSPSALVPSLVSLLLLLEQASLALVSANTIPIASCAWIPVV